MTATIWEKRALKVLCNSFAGQPQSLTDHMLISQKGETWTQYMLGLNYSSKDIHLDFATDKTVN